MLGLEAAVPKADDIGSVRVFDSYAGIEATVLSESENIAAAAALQRSIVSHKAIYERVPIYGYDWGGVLEITYFGHDGRVLLTRAYAAPIGTLAWSSGGNARSTDGNAWGSANPDLAALEALLNTREAVEQRLTLRDFPVSAYTANGGSAHTMAEDGAFKDNLELTGAEGWWSPACCLRGKSCPRSGNWPVSWPSTRTRSSGLIGSWKRRATSSRSRDGGALPRRGSRRTIRTALNCSHGCGRRPGSCNGWA